MHLELREKVIKEEGRFICDERGLSVGNTLQHNSLNKYTRVSSGQDRVELKNLVVLMLGKKAILRDVQNIRTVIGMFACLFVHRRYVIMYL